MPRTSNLNIFLRAIPDNRPIGNVSLRTRLGWDEAKYWKIHRRARAQGHIAVGKGRGGSVVKVGDQAQKLLQSLADLGNTTTNQNLRSKLGWPESRYTQIRKRLEDTGVLECGTDDTVVIAASEADVTVAELLGAPGAQKPPPLRIAPIRGRPFLPTALWIEADDASDGGIKVFQEHPGDRAVYAVENLKGWTLGGDPERILSLDKGRRTRSLHRDRAFRSFLDQLFDAAPRSFISARELCFVMSEAPTESARAHRRLLARVSRGLWPQLPVRFLRETEMVFEYVRLVRGDLAYDSNTPGIYLVVHCSAHQTTFTAIVTSPAVTTDAHVTRRVLRALPSVHISQAGATFDSSLRTEARGQLGLDKDDPSLDAAVEYAKIRVAQIDQPLTLHGPGERSWKLLPKRLRHLGSSIVGSFNRPVHDLLSQATEVLSRNIANVGPKPIRGVILSGGASRLPGIDTALRTLLSLPDEVQLHNLGEQAAAAAAVGAMAHVLHRQGRLRPPESASQIAALEFIPTLLDDIHLLWTVDNNPPQSLPVVQRAQWPLAYRVDEVATVALPSWKKKIATVTFGWGPDAADDEILRVSPPASPWLPIDCTQRLPELHRMALQSGTQILLHTGVMAESRTFETSPIAETIRQAVVRPATASKSLAYVEAGDTLVVEFGTSKTLLVTADGTGSIDPDVFALPGAVSPPPLPAGYRWDPEDDDEDDDEVNGEEDDGYSDDDGASPTEGQPIGTADGLERFGTGRDVASMFTELASPDGTFLVGTGRRASSSTHPHNLAARRPANISERDLPGKPVDIATQTDPDVPTVRDLPHRKDRAQSDESHQVGSSASEGTAAPPVPSRPLRPAELSEAEFLATARDLAVAAGLDIPNDALAAVHLAATTRPFVLLAGPPGLGKTTLAGFYAGLLGCNVDDHTLLWLAIQAHWISDETLVDSDGSQLPPLCARGHAYPDLLQVALLDEFNLTRPEYYLSRYFSALDSRVPLAHRKDGPLRLPTDANGRSRLLTFATLNIDESSRPPSDKILDRAFLIEPAELLRTKKVRRVNLQPPTHRVSAETWSRWCDTPSDLDHPEELDAVLAIFDTHASAHPSIIHESLSPSRRAIHDVCTFIHRYQAIGEEALGGMSRAQALDRASAGRILPRRRGAVAQLRRLLDPLADLFTTQSWPTSLRHITAMKNRVDFGFVSFWG